MGSACSFGTLAGVPRTCKAQYGGVEDRIVNSGQKLFSVGQEARHMHFVMRGEVSYQMKNIDKMTQSWSRSSEELQIVSVQMWFAEQALWLSSWYHLGVAVACQGDAVEVLSL